MKRFIKFLIIGGVGWVIYIGILYTLVEFVGVNYILSAIMAAIASILFNFFVNDRWSFSDRNNGSKFFGFGKFAVVTGLETGMFFGLMIMFTEWLGINYMLSNVMALFVRLPMKYALCWMWVW